MVDKAKPRAETSNFEQFHSPSIDDGMLCYYCLPYLSLFKWPFFSDEIELAGSTISFLPTLPLENIN